MKRWLTFTVVILVVLGAGGYAGWRYYQRQRWNAARLETLDALSRAYEYRDAGTLLFEPRWKDFEVADDNLQRLSLFSSESFDDAELVRLCGDQLRTYRSAEDTAEQAVSLRTDPKDSIDLMKSIDKQIQGCLAKR